MAPGCGATPDVPWEPDQMTEVLDEVEIERRRQDAKWGVQDHSPMEWLAILFEEVGEVSEHVVETHFGRRFTLDGYREEMIQVAAVAVAAVENLDRRLRVAESRGEKVRTNG